MKRIIAATLFALLFFIAPANAQFNSPVLLPGGCGTANFTYGSAYLTVDSSGRLCAAPSVPLNFSMFDFAGDSRTTLSNTGGIPTAGYTSEFWFHWASALSANRYVYDQQNGGSACRTDQFLTQAVLAPLLASQAGWLVIGPSALNDVGPQTGNGLQIANACSGNSGGSFPYINNLGETVTQSTVGALAANHVITAAKSALAIGKNVILIEEMGAASTTQLSVGQVYDFNARMRSYAKANPGRVYLVSFNSQIWDPIASATLVGFLNTTACMSDGTHPTALCAASEGTVFNTAAGTPFWASDLQIASINNVNATNPRQLINNPLFTTLTGGTNAGTCGTVTGNIPSGWTLGCTNANVSVTITSAASAWCGLANRCGNDVTFAVTCTASGTLVLNSNAPSNALWNLTDTLQFSVNVSVANGSSGFSVYNEAAVNTDQGTFDHWGLQAGGGVFGSGPTTAYSYVLASQPGGPLANSITKGFTVAKLYAFCNANGSAGTFTINRASFDRIPQYNPSTNTFTG